MKKRKRLIEITRVASVLLIIALLIYVAYELFLPKGEFNVASFIINLLAFLMVMGLFSSYLPYGFCYHLYFITFIASPAFAFLVWATQRIPHYPFIHAIIVVGISIANFFFHIKTKERAQRSAQIYQITIVVMSLFLFSIIVILSIPQAVPISSYDAAFLMGIGMFSYISLLCLNITHRTKILNDALDFRDRFSRLDFYEKELSRLYPDKSKDIDFILYYLRGTFEDFVSGDFEKSFESAFKIVFDHEFDKLYVLLNIDERRKPYANIRNILAHAKGRKIEKLEELRIVKKNLFKTTLDLLKLVKFEFMDKIIKSQS